MYLIIFSYFGFEKIINLAEEAKNPEKDLPRAIFLSLAITSTLYVLVSIAALALLTPDELASSDAVLAEAANQRSQKIGRILNAVALFSTANTKHLSANSWRIRKYVWPIMVRYS